LHGNGVCTTCAAGLTSRAGSQAASNCQPPPTLSGPTEMHMFDLALGVLAYASPSSATSIHNRRCAVVDAGLSLSCPGELYSLLYDTPLVAKVCFASHDAPSRMGYVVPPGTGRGGDECVVQYKMLRFANTDDTSSHEVFPDFFDADQQPAVSEVVLYPRRGYMGPAPLGWRQEIGLHRAWSAGTTVHIAAKLRMDGTDLRTNMAESLNAVRLIAIVTSQELDQAVGSSAWEWIVCGQKSISSGHNTYKACQNERDPDNPRAVNIRNPAVLDTHVFEIGGPGCCEQSQVPGAEFGRTLLWKPQISEDPENTQPLWLYVYFMVGDSRACASHNCDESAVFSEMDEHMRSYDVVSQPARLVMLPGTSITYTLPGHVPASLAPVSQASRRRSLRMPVLRSTHIRIPERQKSVRVGRKLLVAGSDGLPPTNANTTAAHREITSLNNDAQVIQAICSGKTHNCSMLNVQMAIPVTDYCMPESMLMTKYAPGLVNAIDDMSIGQSVKFFSVVSILRPHFAIVCALYIYIYIHISANAEGICIYIYIG